MMLLNSSVASAMYLLLLSVGLQIDVASINDMKLLQVLEFKYLQTSKMSLVIYLLNI